MRTRLAASLLVVSAGCALPDRDNPRDSSRAPAAVLRIGDATLPDGSCPTLPTSGQPQEVLRASRGRCIVLDASATTDPQSDEIRFRFRMISPRVEEIADGAVPMVAIPEALRRDPTLVEETLTFEVRTSDRSAYSLATATITLTNLAPSVDVGSPRTLPLGGHPWTWDSASTDFTIEFRALRAVDPDGDPVTLCWTLPGSLAEDCTDPEPQITVPSTAPARIRASVRAFDGTSYSSARTALVSIREPNVWTHSDDPFESEDPMERLDSHRRISTALPAATIQHGAYVPDGTVALFVSDVGGGSVALIDIATDSLITSTPDLGLGLGIASSEDGSRIWSVTNCEDGNPLCPNFGGPQARVVTARTWTTPSLAGELAVDISDVPYGIADRDLELSVSGEDLYVSLQLDATLAYVTPIGASSIVAASAGRVFASHDARPFSGELWAVETPVAAQAAEAQISVLVDGVVTDTIPLGIPVAYQMRWVSPERFWIYVPGDGLRFVDAGQLAAGVSLADASVLAPQIFAPTLNGGPILHANVLTGEIVAQGAGASSIVIAREDGSTTSVDVDGNIFFIDPEGSFWFETASAGLAVGDSSSESAVARLAPIGTFAPQYDQSTGGVWAPILIPGALAQLGEDGRVLRFIKQTSIDGAPSVILQDPLLLAMDPDGRAAWSVTADIGIFGILGMSRLDLAGATVDVVPSTIVLDAADAELIGVADGVMQASAPIPGQPRFLSVARTLGADTVIVRLQEDGSGFDAPVFTLPANEGGLRFARSLRDNSLCIATLDTTGTSLFLRQLTMGGALSLLATIPVSIGDELLGVTTSSTPTEELCWVAIRTAPPDSRFVAVGSGGVVRDEIVTDLSLRSILPESRDRVWLTGDTGPDVAVRERADWNGSGFDRTPLGNNWRATFVPYSGQWFDL